MRIYRTGIAALLLILATAACSDEPGQLTVTGDISDAGTVPVTTAISTVVPTTAAAGAAAGEPSLIAAEAEIRHAYATFANANVTQAERDAAVEGGDQASAERTARWEQFKGQAALASFVIDEIRFVSATEADVDFHVRYGNGPSPVVPDVVHGGAVLRDGHWRVSKATACFLAKAVGNTCIL
jgi:hypothetical protein